MSERPIYILTLRAEPGVDGLRALKTLLKQARRGGLKCLSAACHPPGPMQDEPHQASEDARCDEHAQP